MQTTKRLTNKSFKVIFIVLISLLCLDILGIGLTLSWFTNSVKLIAGDLNMGHLRTDLSVYSLDNNVWKTRYEYENNSIKTDNVSNSPKIEIGPDMWTSDSVGAIYIKANNMGNIDSKIFLQLSCKEIENMDENSLNYIYVRIQDITSQMGSKTLETYARDFEQSLAVSGATATEAIDVKNNGGVTLANVIKEAKRLDNIVESGQTRYYRVEYAIPYVPSDLLKVDEQKLALDMSFSIQQHNMPDEFKSTNNTIYVDSEAAFMEVMAAAASGDTVILSNDIDLQNYNLTITQRINIDLNGYNLHVGGNMAYNFVSSGTCKLIIPSTSQLLIDGDLLIDAPTTENFVIDGSGTDGIILGRYDEDQKKVFGGSFYANTKREDGQGLTINKINVKKRNTIGSTSYADIIVRTGTSVNIGVSTHVNNIISETGADNIYIINNGYVNRINMSTMSYRGLDEDQLYIVNNGVFTCADSIAPVILPAWARGYKSSISPIDNSDHYQVNTVVVNNPGRDIITVGVKYNSSIYTSKDPTTAKEYYGENNEDIENIYFWNQDISRENVSNSRVIRNSEGNYIVYLFGDPCKGEPESIANRLVEFWEAEENKAYAGESIVKLTVRTYSMNDGSNGTDAVQGMVKHNDWVYLKSIGASSLQVLDLSGAIFENNKIEDDAMNGATALREVSFPTVGDLVIGARAFNNTDVHFVTLYANTSDVGTNAFIPKAESAYDQFCFVKWMGGLAPDEAIVDGLNPNNNILFMDESLIDSFRNSHSAWDMNVYELFDYVTTNKGFYRITGETDATLVYYHDKMLNCDGDTSGVLPATTRYDDRTYKTTAIGYGAFRRAISTRNNIESDVSFSLNIPTYVTKIGSYAFQNATISDLNLKYVKVIGNYAFANCWIKKSEARPSDFSGVISLGAYIFNNSVIGVFQNDNFTISEYQQNAIELNAQGKFSSYDKATKVTTNYNYVAGVLDLHGNYSLTSGKTFNNAKFIGIEINLSGITAFYGPEYTDNTNLCNPFEGSNFYGCSISFNGAKQLGQAVLANKFNEGKTGLKLYSNIDMRNVEVVETNFFSTLYANKVEMGISTMSERANYRAPIVSGNVDIGLLDITGSLPDNGSNKQWFSSSSVNIGILSLHDYIGKLPSYFLCDGSTTYNHDIDTISVVNTKTGDIEFGEKSFYYCDIGTINIDVKGALSFDKNAFTSVKANRFTAKTTGAVITAEEAFSAAIFGTFKITDATNITFGLNSFKTTDFTNSDGEFSIETTNNINVGIKSFNATKFGSFTIKSSTGSMTIGSLSFTGITIDSEKTLKLSSYSGFEASDTTNDNGSFKGATLYGTLEIETLNGSADFGDFSMQSIGGNGTLKIKAKDLFTCGKKAFESSTFSVIKRYCLGSSSDTWELTPSNYIDKVSYYSFKNTKCTISGGGVLSLERLSEVDTGAFYGSNVLNPHVTINTPTLKVLAPCMFQLTNVRSLNIPYVESVYSPDSLENTYSALNEAKLLAEIYAPSLTNFNGTCINTFSLTKIVLGNAAYGDYVTKKILPSNYDERNISIYFKSSSTLDEFKVTNYQPYLLNYDDATKDIVAVDANYATNHDVDGLFRINDCFIGQYIIRANNDGTYRIVRLHSPYSASNPTSPSYQEYVNYTIPDVLYGYKENENGVMVVDTTKKYTITGVEFGSLCKVSFSGSLTFASGITQYGYSNLYGKIDTDYTSIINDDSKKITSLTFPDNANFGYSAFRNVNFSGLTALNFGKYSTFYSYSFKDNSFANLPYLIFGEGSDLKGDLLFENSKLSNATYIDFGLNTNLSGTWLFHQAAIAKVEKITFKATKAGLSIGSEFFFGENSESYAAKELKEISVTGYAIGSWFFENCIAPNLNTITFINCDLHGGNNFESTPKGINKNNINLTIKNSKIQVAVIKDGSLDNCRATIVNSDFSGGTTAFGPGSTITATDCTFSGGVLSIDSNSTVTATNCTQTSGGFKGVSTDGTTIDISTCTSLRAGFVSGYWNKVTIGNGKDSSAYDYANSSTTAGIIAATYINEIEIAGAFQTYNESSQMITSHLISGKVKKFTFGSYYQEKNGLALPNYALSAADFSDFTSEDFAKLISLFDTYGDYCFSSTVFPTDVETIDLNNKTFGKYAFKGCRFDSIKNVIFNNSSIGGFCFDGATFIYCEKIDFLDVSVESEGIINTKFKNIKYSVNLRGTGNIDWLFESCHFTDVTAIYISNYTAKGGLFYKSVISNTETITIDSSSFDFTNYPQFLDVGKLIISNSTFTCTSAKYDIDDIEFTNCTLSGSFSGATINANITANNGSATAISFQNVKCNKNVVWKLNSFTTAAASMFENITGSGSVCLEMPSLDSADYNNMFKNSFIIKQVTFGDALTSFGSATSFLCDAEKNNEYKTVFILKGSSKVTAIANTFGADSSYPSEFKIYVPESLLASYKGDPVWTTIESHIFVIPKANTDSSSNWYYTFVDTEKTKVSINGVGTSFVMPQDNVLDIPAYLDDGNGHTYAVVEIGRNICFGISPLQVVIPETVSFIETHAFSNIGSLTSFSISGHSDYFSTTKNGKAIMSKDGTVLYVVLPDISNSAVDISALNSVEIVYSYAFEGVTTLSTLTLTGATTISSKAFYGSAISTSLSLPNVRTIASRAFENANIQEFHFGDYLTTIGDAIFGDSGLTRFTEVYITATTPPTLLGDHTFETRTTSVSTEGNIYYYSIPEHLEINVPRVATYLGSFYWQPYRNILVDTLPRIDTSGTWKFDFTDETQSSVVLERYVSTNPLTDNKLVIPESIEVVDDKGIKKMVPVVALGEGIDIGVNPTVIQIPNSVSTIEPGCFDGLLHLESFEVTGPDHFRTELEGKALVSSDGTILYAVAPTITGTVYLPNVTKVCSFAFERVNVSYIVLPEVTEVEDYAFYLAYVDWTLSIPKASDEGSIIGEKAFASVNKICLTLLTPEVTIAAADTNVNFGYYRITSISKFNVDTANTKYGTILDGKALTSIDGKTLYCVLPSISGDDVDLDLTGVTTIAANAFYGVKVRSIYVPDAINFNTGCFDGAEIGILTATNAKRDIYDSQYGTNVAIKEYTTNVAEIMSPEDDGIEPEVVEKLQTSGVTRYQINSLANEHYATNTDGTILTSKDGSKLYSYLPANTETEVTLTGVTIIGGNAFNGVTLTSLELPNVTKIEAYAFKGATINSLTAPSGGISGIEIDEHAFDGATITSNGFQMTP